MNVYWIVTFEVVLIKKLFVFKAQRNMDKWKLMWVFWFQNSKKNPKFCFNRLIIIWIVYHRVVNGIEGGAIALHPNYDFDQN